MARFARNPLSLLQDLARTHGDVVRLGFFGYHLISHPDHVQHVLQDHHANYGKGRTVRRRSGGLFGEGLVVNDRDWRQQRRALLPALAPRAVREYVPLAADETLRAIERWRRLPGLELKSELRRLTQSVIVRTLLRRESGSCAERLGDVMAEIGRYVDASMRAPFFVSPGIPTPRNLRFRRAVRALDAALLELRRDAAGRAPGGDLVSLLLRERCSERRIRDELVTLFVAGHETATNTLCWTLIELSRNRAVRRLLAEEVARVVGDRIPEAADLDRLVTTDRVLREVLRLHPPAWVFVREPREDDVIGGHRIPAGSSLLLCSYVTHRRAELWEDPERFDPERFDPERSRERPKFAWYPFGGGPRVCLGQAFAMAEMKTVLALLCRHLPLELEDAGPVAPDPKLTLEPKGALRARTAPGGWLAPG